MRQVLATLELGFRWAVSFPSFPGEAFEAVALHSGLFYSASPTLAPRKGSGLTGSPHLRLCLRTRGTT